jgi:hypothetical protein
MKADRQLPTRAQGDAKRDGGQRIGGDCFAPYEGLKHFEPGEVEARVQAAIDRANLKRVCRMNRKRRG